MIKDAIMRIGHFETPKKLPNTIAKCNASRYIAKNALNTATIDQSTIVISISVIIMATLALASIHSSLAILPSLIAIGALMLYNALSNRAKNPCKKSAEQVELPKDSVKLQAPYTHAFPERKCYKNLRHVQNQTKPSDVIEGGFSKKYSPGNNCYVKNECYLVSTCIYLNNIIKHDRFSISPKEEAIINKYIRFTIPLTKRIPTKIIKNSRMRRLTAYYLVKHIHDIAMEGGQRASTAQYVKALQTLSRLQYEKQGDIYATAKKLKRLLGGNKYFEASGTDIVHADVLNSNALKNDLRAIMAGDKGLCYDDVSCSGYKITDNSACHKVDYMCIYRDHHFYDLIRGEDDTWFKIDTNCPRGSSLKVPVDIKALMDSKTRVIRIVAKQQSLCGAT